MSTSDYAYSRYCDAVDEINETYGCMYRDEWKHYVHIQYEYLTCLDAMPDFLFSDHLPFLLYEFSLLCRKIDY